MTTITITKTWTVNLYNDARNPRRLTEERALPPGTKIRGVERASGTRGDWTAAAELAEGEWYRVYSWEPAE